MGWITDTEAQLASHNATRAWQEGHSCSCGTRTPDQHGDALRSSPRHG